MAKLPVVSGKEMVKVLKKIGFKVDRMRGSHIFLIKTEPKFRGSVCPVSELYEEILERIVKGNHKELKKKTLKNILKTSGLGTDDLVKLLNGKKIK